MTFRKSINEFPANSLDNTPPFLTAEHPLELEDIPLQVLLLTMETALQRQRLDAITRPLPQAAPLLEQAMAQLNTAQVQLTQLAGLLASIAAMLKDMSPDG